MLLSQGNVRQINYRRYSKGVTHAGRNVISGVSFSKLQYNGADFAFRSTHHLSVGMSLTFRRCASMCRVLPTHKVEKHKRRINSNKESL
jgi:hypothetical protein